MLEDPAALPWGDEPILRDGRVVGAVTSAAFGHTLGRAVAMGYVREPAGVDERYIETGAFALDIGGERVPARGEPRRPVRPARAADQELSRATGKDRAPWTGRTASRFC